MSKAEQIIDCLLHHRECIVHYKSDDTDCEMQGWIRGVNESGDNCLEIVMYIANQGREYVYCDYDTMRIEIV